MKMYLICLFLLCDLITKAQIISTVAGNGGAGYLGDGGSATLASIGSSGIIALDKHGNFYFSQLNNTIRKVSLTGVISTIAGNGIAGFSGDGGPATAAMLNFTGGSGVVFDKFDNLFIADQANNRIRKIDATTGIISTIAGIGIGGFAGDGGLASAAMLNSPSHITIDTFGNLYILDGLNYRIRKINTTGIISTLAGTGTMAFSGDGGPATAAELYVGGCMAVGNNNELYLADGIRVRKIDLNSNIITTIAGNGSYGFSGDSGPASSAQFFSTMGIAIDKSDNIYIGDRNNHRIRSINSAGVIMTLTGNGIGGFSGDGGLAASAQIYSPRGLAIDPCGSLYIVDNANLRIRKVTMPPTLTIPTITLEEGEGSASTPLGSPVTVNATITNAGSSYLVRWMNHGIVFATTTVPSITYTKPPGIDTITARVVSTAAYGCYDSTTSAAHIVTSSTGLGTLYSFNTFTMYPNPTQAHLTISADFAIRNVVIVNLLGQELLVKDCNEDKVELDISHFPKGMYFVKVNDIYLRNFLKE
jgi:trimeric autotransporter adhesin